MNDNERTLRDKLADSKHELLGAAQQPPDADDDRAIPYFDDVNVERGEAGRHRSSARRLPSDRSGRRLRQHAEGDDPQALADC